MKKGDLKQKSLRPKEGNSLRHAKRIFAISAGFTAFFSLVMATTAKAADLSINVGPTDAAGGMGAMEVLFTLAFLSLLPSVILMMTSFTRIIIVLGFMRSAIGTAQSPPNLVLTGLALFLSLFIMMPVINEMNEVAYQPYSQGEMSATEALAAASVPVKRFMLEETTPESLRMFLDLSGAEVPQVADATEPTELLELSLLVVTPAFITSEISRAFMMGFFIYLPFLIIDIVVSSILMSMGMVMLPPAMISLPFKLLMFVMVDGWNLMMKTLVNSYL